jgi:hypothetical protein
MWSASDQLVGVRRARRRIPTPRATMNSELSRGRVHRRPRFSKPLASAASLHATHLQGLALLKFPFVPTNANLSQPPGAVNNLSLLSPSAPAAQRCLRHLLPTDTHIRSASPLELSQVLTLTPEKDILISHRESCHPHPHPCDSYYKLKP